MTKDNLPEDATGFPEIGSDLSSQLDRIHGFGDSMLQFDLDSESGQAPKLESGSSRYTSEEQIGRGGMGTVYRVRDSELRRKLAMKVLTASQEVDPEQGTSHVDRQMLRRFLEEAQVTAQLDHPAIIGVHELGVDQAGRVYFTMPLVRGQEFGELLDLAREGRGGWNTRRVVSCMVRVAEAMSYAHSKGIVHRDLKPANIMAGRFGEVHVMDWGLAKVIGQDSFEGLRETAPMSLYRPDADGDSPDALETGQGSVLGTPAYMAPEQARGEHDEVGPAADVYSFGAILYQLISGQPPYVPAGAHIAGSTVLKWLVEGPPQPVGELAARDVPAELIAICEMAMARDPMDRYASMESLAEDLQRFLRDEPVQALPIGALGRVVRWCTRNPMAVGLLLTVTVGGAAALWGLSTLSTDLVHQSARDGAAMKAAMIEDVNGLYSDEVAARVAGHGVITAHDYDSLDGAIPLPATFLTLLGREISKNESGVEVRHYSDFPFQFRLDQKEGGPKDEFEVAALASLRANPDEPYYRFVEEDGASYLRYAAPRIMGATCVECHNDHPSRAWDEDWEVGDVRGVLSIKQPLGEDLKRAQSWLRTMFFAVGAAAAAFLGLLTWWVVRGRRPAAAA